ncbi:peptide deformylase [Paenibacillus alkalitolerans]|uniref:peptide deformylase n=1 Tax=Paenibacillus alkalitolerans TaxID=2799335 RepID=UPI0018F2867D|nr:peptide deformylase [Paenibacillus alkalitolerans]
MAERAILPFGDPILRKIAKPVDQVSPKILKLLDDLADTIYAAEGRAGLAAPQVGILRRVIVMDCGEGLIELMNPEIVESKGDQTGPEACLSFPGYTGIVSRAKYVKLTSLNRSGETVTIEAEDYTARCIQHEIDHLNGVLFVDRIQDNGLYHDQTRQRINLFDVLQMTKLNN